MFKTSDYKKIQQEAKKAERTVDLFGFVGHNRTGKSVTAAELAKAWKEGHPNGTVMSFDPQKRFTEVTDRIILPKDKDWAEQALEMREGLLILDEFRVLHPANIMSDGMLSLMSYRSEYAIDIFYIVHNPALILTQLASFTTKYFIFYTLALVGQFEKKIPNYHLCHGASQFINKYVQQYGRGDYPNFPYMLVDIEKETIEAINIDRNKVKKLTL